MEDIKTAMSFQCDYLAVSLPEERDRHGHGAPAANVAGEPCGTSRC